MLKQQPETRDFPAKYYGLRLIGISDLFEALCWCVIGQQINLTFAHKVKTRLVKRYGDKVVSDNNTYYSFPSPEILIHAKHEELESDAILKTKD